MFFVSRPPGHFVFVTVFLSVTGALCIRHYLGHTGLWHCVFITAVATPGQFVFIRALCIITPATDTLHCVPVFVIIVATLEHCVVCISYYPDHNRAPCVYYYPGHNRDFESHVRSLYCVTK